jgi:two-component sensor histidine kinase
MALATHELATNAAKYGALSRAGGHVAVRWTVSNDRLNFSWRETGGPPVQHPDRRGFGSRMIERGLASELGGSAKLDFQEQGLRCTIDAPAPQQEQELVA